MTRDEKIAEARRLRAEGVGYKTIAKRIDQSVATVYRWLNPNHEEEQRRKSLAWKERNREQVLAYYRAYEDEHRGTCIRCGGEMGRGSRGRTGRACQECRIASRDARWALIQKRWAEGVSHRELADYFGWTEARLGIEKARMRAAGIDLPYREGYPRHRSEVAA